MSKKSSLIVGTAFVALLGVGLYYAKSRTTAAAKPHRTSLVSVVTTQVVQRDTPIYLDGIGTVAAYNTVTVTSLISGQVTGINFKEGQMVKAGDLLATIDARSVQAQLDQAGAKKAQDEATLANAQLDLKRTTYLFSQKTIGQQAMDTQSSLVAQTQALVQSDEAALENARVQLSYTRVTAPLSGRLGLRLVDEGNVVQANTTALVVITQLQPITVVFTLPQSNLAQIQKSTATDPALKVIAYDQDSAHPIDTGVLSVMSNQIDTTTGTLSFKATFPNTASALWPGQFVNIRLLVDTRKDGIIVPAAVVQIGPSGDFAFVVTKDDTVTVRPVTVAQIDEGYALIDQGLTPGETVVVDGQYKLQDGSKVTIAPPAGAAPATSTAPATTPAAAPKGHHGHKQKPQASE